MWSDNFNIGTAFLTVYVVALVGLTGLLLWAFWPTYRKPSPPWIILAILIMLVALIGFCSPLYAQEMPEVRLIARDYIPGGKLAHTYPAEVFLEGKEGSAVIAFKASWVRGASKAQYRRVLLHELGHAKYDLAAIRRGEKVDCKRAEAYAQAQLRR